MMTPPLPVNTPIVQTCGQPNKEVSVVRAATPPPTSYLGEITSPVQVLVEVSVGPDGDVERAHIYRSSGNEKLDKAAIVAARNSSFSPRVADCSEVGSEYLYRVLFAPPSPSPSPIPSPHP